MSTSSKVSLRDRVADKLLVFVLKRASKMYQSQVAASTSIGGEVLAQWIGGLEEFGRAQDILVRFDEQGNVAFGHVLKTVEVGADGKTVGGYL